MNLQCTIDVYAGGVGSGCRGSNCGRPVTLSKGVPSKRFSQMVHDVFIDGKKVGECRISKYGGNSIKVEWLGEPLGKGEYAFPQNQLALQRKLGIRGLKSVVGEIKRLYPKAHTLYYERTGGAAGEHADVLLDRGQDTEHSVQLR